MVVEMFMRDLIMARTPGATAQRARARRATADMNKAVVVALQDISQKAIEGDAEAQLLVVNLAASEQFSSLLESVGGRH